MENTLFVEDSEIITLLNTARQELDGELLLNGLQVPETWQTIAANGAHSYALPSDYFSTLRVFCQANGRMTPIPRGGRSDETIQGSSATPAGYPDYYRVQNGYITFYPAPSTGTYIHVYVPEAAALTSASTVNYPLGWEQYLVLHAAEACLGKEETVNPVVSGKLAELRARIGAEAAHRDLTQSHQIGLGDNSFSSFHSHYWKYPY